MKKLLVSGFLVAVVAMSACGSGQGLATVPSHASWSKRIADSFLLRHPTFSTYDTVLAGEKWNYEQGLMLEAFNQMWLSTGDKKYLEFIRKNLEQYVNDNGTIRTYKPGDFSLDDIAGGRALLMMYNETKLEKFKKAADLLRQQLSNQPRTSESGFWHKKIYPYQMWLDGMFMAEPFFARYAAMFHEPADFDDIANQFLLIARHTHDPKTGLFYHGWDESKTERWANPETGCSSNFWGRAIGWYAMALVDVLDDFPTGHQKRQELLAMLKDLADAVLKYRDEKTYLWHQVVDQQSREGNYLEASASCMFVYCFAKGVNRGYLDRRFHTAAEQSFRGIVSLLVTIEEGGLVDLHGTCRGAGLGGTPYRDGSYEYYIGEPQRTNDLKGVGPFLLAAIELEKGKANQ